MFYVIYIDAETKEKSFREFFSEGDADLFCMQVEKEGGEIVKVGRN